MRESFLPVIYKLVSPIMRDLEHQELRKTIDKRSSVSSLVFWFSIACSIGLILVTAFQWTLMDILTGFLFSPLSGFMWITFWICLACSVVYSFLGLMVKDWRTLLPLGINISCILIVLFVPFTAISIDLDFRINYEKRAQVVSMVESGKLQPNVNYDRSLILLPAQYRGLSNGGGEIVVERAGNATEILFYSFRGVLGNFSGFVYRADDTAPTQGDLGGNFVEIEKLREKWYWVAARN